MANSRKRKENSMVRKFFYFLTASLITLGVSLALNGSTLWNEERNIDPSLLTLERIFSSREFAADRFGPALWLEDSSGYLVLEGSEAHPGYRDVVRYAVGGKREILVPAEYLIPPGESTPLRMGNIVLSSDGSQLLILTNAHRIFHKTFGDYWILNIKKKKLWKLGGQVEPGSLTLSTFSPDSQKIAYVYKNNIYVESLDQDGIIQITKDGTEDIINGTFDYVFEEEFFMTNGFRWSPDSQSIAYWQMDTRDVSTFHMINNTDSLYPRLISFKFSKPGEKISTCRIGVVSADGGKTRWFQVQGDPSDHYIPQMDWAGNSNEILFQHLNRLQNRNGVMMGDASTGRVNTIMTDTDDAWVHILPNVHWLNNGGKFLWMSERDGWRHAYLVSRSGQEMTLLTPGNYDVESIEGVDETGGWLYYLGSPDNPTQRYLYRVSLDGTGNTERITPQELQGSHSYQLSPDSRWAFHSYSRFDTPPVTSLIRLPDHGNIRTLVTNSELREKVESLDRGPAEFFRIDIGHDVSLDAWSMKPPDFDPEKKYPALFYVYGEPWGSTVRDMWGGDRYLWHLMLTQQGYLVMSVDNRGTRVPRGRAWRKIIYRQVGILASADQAAAVRAVISSRNYVDPDRIGIWGRSGGGAMTLNAMFRYPDLYKTGMSVAPVTNQRLYNSIYQERYMGLPKDNEEGYEKGSPATFAHQLKGNLLLVHGTGDDNVHYQNTEVLINELIKHNKPFTLMSYPNRSHGIREGINTTLHLYGLLTRFLNENLPPGPKAR
jgi:dipeptidyl-peptidase-4